MIHILRDAMNLTFNNRQFQALDASSVAEALAMLRDGCEREPIARFLGVPLWALADWIRLDEDAKAARAIARARIKANPRTRGLDDASKDKALEMLGAGVSTKAAAEALGIEAQNLNRWAALNPEARAARAAGALLPHEQRLETTRRTRSRSRAAAPIGDGPQHVRDGLGSAESGASRGTRNRMDSSKKPEALNLLRSGATHAQIAAILGVSRASATDWIARDPEAKAAWDEQLAPKRERRARVVEMLRSGATRTQVAEFLGITRGGLKNWMQRHPAAQRAWEAQLAPLPKQRARAIELIRSGASRKAVAGALGVADFLLAAHWIKTDAEAQAAWAQRNALKPHAPRPPRRRVRAARFDEAAVADALKAWDSSRTAS